MSGSFPRETHGNLHSFLDAYWWFKGFRNTTGACWQRASLVLRSRSTSAPQLKQMIRDQKTAGIHNQTWQRKIPMKLVLVLMGKSTTNTGKIIERHLKWAIVQCHVSLLEGTKQRGGFTLAHGARISQGKSSKWRSVKVLGTLGYRTNMNQP